MRYKVLIVFLLSLSIAGSCPSQEIPRNLALHKPYTLEPAPNYALCTDPGDRTQLTDGDHVKGTLWTQRGTVGWAYASSVLITLDLGQVAPIGGLSYSTSAGIAGVGFPLSIAILVSDDGTDWTPVGDLVELGQRKGRAPSGGYQAFCFRTEDLATRGRFVQLIITPTGPYVFVDEIEVLEGHRRLLEVPQAVGAIRNTRAFVQALRFQASLRRRLVQDLEKVRTSVGNAPLGEDSRRGLTKDVDRLSTQIVSEDLRANPSQRAGALSTVFPINTNHEQVFAIQAATWRGNTSGQLVVWQNNRWDMLSPTEAPQTGPVSLQVALMRGEFRSEAFNLTNTTSKVVEVALRFEGLPDAPLPDYIQIHEVLFSDTQSGVPVAAALPLAERSGKAGEPGGPYAKVRLIPGLTRQIWLSFHPIGLPPGEYVGNLHVRPLSGGAKDSTLPLRMKVYPLTFPSQPLLHLGGWDYTDREVIDQVGPGNREIFIRHLRDHFVDSPWAQAAVLPPGRFDSEGRMVQAPDTQAFERWVHRWPGARRYFVFLNTGTAFSGLAMGTPAFQKAVSSWMTWWASQLPRWKIRPEQLGLLLVDEPLNPTKDRIVVAWAKAIRSARTGVEIWENPAWDNPTQANPEVFSLSDALCPHLPTLQDQGKAFASFFQAQQQAGRRLWFYSSRGPSKLLDPYSYYRLQPWFCWKYGAVGAFYWSFSDSQGTSDWSEYLATGVGSYSPLFLDGKSVIAGKHMEAIREGIEDVEYLRMLRDRITAAETKGRSGPALVAAKSLLAAAVEQVTACMKSSVQGQWTEPKDRSVADRVRIQILDAMVALGE